MKDLRKLVVSGVVASTLLLGSVSTYAASFDDVSGLDSEMSITKLVSLGYFVNKGSDFHPESGLTRGEFADLAAKLVYLGKAPSKKVKIKDSKNANAAKLVSKGYFKLTKKGEFLPKKGLTYAELSKVLASGLGFKTSWSNRPIDFLFFLERKGVLSIDTNLNAVVTKEAAAVTVDKYLQAKDVYKDLNGVIVTSSPTSITVKSDSGVKTYKISSNASLFLDDQATDTDALGLGTAVEVIFDRTGKVAFVDGAGLDSYEGALGYSNGKITVGTTQLDVDLNLVVSNLPSNPDKDFTFREFTAYSAAGVSYFGSVYTNYTNDQVTTLNAAISKINEAGLTVSATGSYVFDYSESALENLTLTADEAVVVNVTKDGKTEVSSTSGLVTLQSEGYKLTASVDVSAEGKITVVNVKAEKPAPAAQ
jgi:hypothetical protein